MIGRSIKLAGTLLPGDEDYDSGREVFNAMIDKGPGMFRPYHGAAREGRDSGAAQRAFYALLNKPSAHPNATA